MNSSANVHLSPQAIEAELEKRSLSAILMNDSLETAFHHLFAKTNAACLMLYDAHAKSLKPIQTLGLMDWSYLKIEIQYEQSSNLKMCYLKEIMSVLLLISIPHSQVFPY